MKRQNVVYTFKKRETNFFTFVENAGLYRIYGCQYHKLGRVICIESRNGIEYSNEQVVLKNSCASHNFYVYYANGSYFATGGLDSWKQNKKWKDTDLTFDRFKILFKNQFGREYDRDEKRFLKFKERIPQEPSYDHCDGLYSFVSSDGIVWDNEKVIEVGKPFLTTKYNGFRSALDWGKASEFDGHISNLCFKGIVYIYLRDNIREGHRGIQYSKRANGFKPLNLPGENYYTACMMVYKDKVIGLLPYYEKNMCCIRLVVSDNGVDFKVKKDLFKDAPAMSAGKPKNKCHFVNGYFIKNGELNFYMHENYFGLDKNKPVQLVRYTINEKDFDQWIS